MTIESVNIIIPLKNEEKSINDLIDNLNKIAPYGLGNPKPKFLFYNVKIIKPKLIGETKKHLSFLNSLRPAKDGFNYGSIY